MRKIDMPSATSALRKSRFLSLSKRSNISMRCCSIAFISGVCSHPVSYIIPAPYLR